MTCINKTCENIDYCEKINDKCVLTLPKINLINYNNNETNYYGIVADELLRYINIRNYLFSSNEYLVMDTLNYNLHKNEIILFEGMIKSYLENISNVKKNNYIENNTFDTANILNGNRSKMVDLKEKQKIFVTREQIKELTPRDKLKQLLPAKSFKLEIKNKSISFNKTFISIINDFTKQKFNNQTIKNILIEIYRDLKKPITVIYNKLNNDGKRIL